MNAYVLLILTILFWGVTPIIEKHGLSDINPILAVFIRSIAVIFSLIIIGAFSGVYKEVAKLSTKTIILFSLSGLLAGVLGMITYFSILKTGQASKIVPLSATYPLVTAVLGFIFLGENFSITKIIGTLLICSGIILLELV